VERRLRDDDVLTVMVDEVQKLPGLLDEVHYLLEKHKPRVRFVLTGSRRAS
jgi:predicted AAA+ superfamily ATPase